MTVLLTLAASVTYAGDAQPHSSFAVAFLTGPAGTFTAFAEVAADGSAADSLSLLLTLTPGSYSAGFQTFSFTSAADGTGGQGGHSASVQIEAVTTPEPSTLALLGLIAGFGLGGYALRCRRVAIAA